MLNPCAILVIVAASLLKGITGFGFALVSLPLLMIWYSPKELIPVLMMSNLIASIFIILQKKESKLVSKQFMTLIIYGGLFTILGVITLKYVSNTHLIKFMGIFFVLLTILTLLNNRHKFNLTTKSYKLAGAFIGFLTGSISVSGPPLALFLNMANVTNREFREVFSWFSVVSATVAIAGYAHLGLITKQSLLMTLSIIPILLLGSVVGKKLNSRVPSAVFKQFNLWLTLIISIFLLMK